jgi:hypothetical protein
VKPMMNLAEEDISSFALSERVVRIWPPHGLFAATLPERDLLESLATATQ